VDGTGRAAGPTADTSTGDSIAGDTVRPASPEVPPGDPQIRAIVDRLHDGLVPVPVGTQVTLVGSWNDEFSVTAGVIDDQAIKAYNGGQCHALAIAINKRKGWPIVALMNYAYNDDDDPEEPTWELMMTHVGALTPEGDFVDINGRRPVADVVNQYIDDYYGAGDAEGDEFGIEVVTPGRLAGMLDADDMRPPAMDVAVTFVDAVLAKDSVPA